MGYKGDSPQKIMARSTAYSQVSRRDFYTKKHIVIASRDCGDIRYLIGCGVDPKNIIACDVDVAARDAAEKYGVILSPFNTIQDTVKWAIQRWGKDIVTINVDLCASLRKGVPVLHEVYLHLNDSPVINFFPLVFFTFLRGRDGFRNNTERQQFLVEQGHYWDAAGISTTWLEYQSHTRTSVGSPMCMLVLH